MIVVDASAMVDAVAGDAPDPALLALLTEEPLHAPSLLDYEVTSAFRGHALAGKLSDLRLSQAVDDYTAFRVERHSMTGVLGDILDMRHNFTAYDAAYAVLALALEAPLATCDAKLMAAASVGVEVRLFAPTE